MNFNNTCYKYERITDSSIPSIKIIKVSFGSPYTNTRKYKYIHQVKSSSCSTIDPRFFDENASQALAYAHMEGINEKKRGITPCHLFMGLLLSKEEGTCAALLNTWNIDYLNYKEAYLKSKYSGLGNWYSHETMLFDQDSLTIMDRAADYSVLLGHDLIGCMHILLAMFDIKQTPAIYVLRDMMLSNYDDLEKFIQNIEPGTVPKRDKSLFYINFEGEFPPLDEDYQDIIRTFGQDLTQKALDGKSARVIGRHDQIKRIIRVLGRKSKNNPCLVGEPGVGKTAIAEGLALRIAEGTVPDFLRGKRVINLELSKIVSGSKYRGDFENRMISIIRMAKEEQRVILFIDEIHTLVGAGAAEGTLDAANMLKPALSRGEIKLIGATTIEEFRKYIKEDGALERRFQSVDVPEPTKEESIEILQGLRVSFGEHHNVYYSDEAIRSCVEFAIEYINDKFLPDKAIDLLDEAGSYVRLRNSGDIENFTKFKDLHAATLNRKRALYTRNSNIIFDAIRKEIIAFNEAKANNLFKMEGIKVVLTEFVNSNVVSGEDVAEVLEELKGIKATKTTQEETKQLLNLEKTLSSKVIGQEAAVASIASAIKRSRVGLRDPSKPIASLLFAGPTGVGKSELAKALAREYFGSEESMIRFDMSEFSEKHHASRLTGSPPGYVGHAEGGQLTEAVGKKPQSLLLFDEVEKGHIGIYTLFLQILEDGRLADSRGKLFNFKNTIIIMTSNLGAKEVARLENERGGLTKRERNSIYNEAIGKFFAPEFINRLDDIIFFNRLSGKVIDTIFYIFIDQVRIRAERIGINFSVSNRLKDHIINKGYNPKFGARPLKRTIGTFVEEPLSEFFLSGKLNTDLDMILDIYDGKVKIINYSPDSIVNPLAFVYEV